MPRGLKRFHQSRQLHFLTFSCYHRRPNFGSIESRRTFESALERVRTKYGLYVYGYVVMPEHVHLLVSEPQRENPGPSPAVAEAGSRAQAGSARRGFLLAGPVLRLQRVERKEICEKLRYIHRNPVRRGRRIGYGAVSVTTPPGKRARWKFCRAIPIPLSALTSRSGDSNAALPPFAENNSATSTSACFAACPRRPARGCIQSPCSKATRPSRPPSWKWSTRSPATPSTCAAPTSSSKPSGSP